MTHLDLTMGATRYRLSDLALWLEEDGIGPAPGHRLSERGPQQHGDSDLGYRLDPRFVQYAFLLSARTQAGLREKRQQFNRAMRWTERPMHLAHVYDDGVTLQLDVLFNGLVPGQWIGPTSQRVVASFKANDPTWYDPTPVVLPFNPGGSTHVLSVPVSVPMRVGVSTMNALRLLPYNGDVDSYPVIRIVGPVTNLVITNNVTHADGREEAFTLDFTGTTIPSGVIWTIDTRYGAKTIVDNATPSNNQIGTLVDATSQLTGFRVVAGDNSVRVTGTAITGVTQVIFQYHHRYSGG